jgi:hypothetical protein
VKKKQSFFHSLMSLEGERLIGLAEAEGHLFGAKVFLKKIKINIRIIKAFICVQEGRIMKNGSRCLP